MLTLHTAIFSRRLKVFVLFSSLLFAHELRAQIVTSTTDGGNWASDTTWVGGLVPSSLDNVVIATGATVTMRSPYSTAAPAICDSLIINGTLTIGGESATIRKIEIVKTLVINSGGVLTSNGMAIHQITIGEDFINNGTFIPTVSTGSILVTFNGTGTQVIDSNDLGSIVINKTSGQVEVSSNVATLGLISLTLTDGDFIAPSMLSLSGNFSNNDAGNGFQAGTGTILFNGTTQSIGGAVSTTFYNVTSTNNAVVTPTRSTTVNGNLTIENGGTFNVGGFDFTVNGTANVGNGSTGSLIFTSTIGSKIFGGLVTVSQNGTWDNTIGENVSFRGGISNNGTFNASTATCVFTTNSQSVSGTIVTSRIEVEAGVTLTNNGTLTVTTALAGDGSLGQGADATLNIGGTSIIIGFTANGTGNTVNYTGGVQTIRGINYVNLGLSGTDVSHVKTLSGATSTISGNFSLTGTTSSSTVTNLTIGGNLSLSGNSSFAMAGDNVTVTGTTTIGLNSTLVFSSTIGIKTFSGLITVDGTWNNSGNENIQIQSGILNNGTFTAGTGNYRFEVNSQSIEGDFSFSNAEVVSGVTLTLLNGGVTINNVLTVNGILDIGNNILSIGETGTIAITTPSATSMIITSGTGEVRKVFIATGSFTFPVGEATGTSEYSPVSVQVLSATGFSSAYVGVSVVDAKHPNNNSSTDFLTRYWKISQSGISGCEVAVVGTYLNDDISGTEGSIISGQLTGTFNQVTNGWKPFQFINSNILATGAANLLNGQSSIFTGISSVSPTVAITGGDNAAVCAGTPVNLGANVTGEPTIAYAWTPSTGLSATDVANPSATPTTTTDYTLTVYDANGISATDNTTVNVTPLPAKPTITPSDLNTETPKLTSSSASGNQWYKDGTIINDATNQELIVTADGSYTVAVTASGCSSPLSDEYVIVIVGIDENGITKSSRVYPNPASTAIQFDRSGFLTGVEIEVKVYDLMGRLHISKRIVDEEISLGVESLSKGQHILVATQNNMMVIQKFVKN